jgi:hypothetical protein
MMAQQSICQQTGEQCKSSDVNHKLNAQLTECESNPQKKVKAESIRPKYANQ